MARKSPAKPAKKSTKARVANVDKSSAHPSGRLMVPQPHGGALVPGAGGGPQPGSGRPPSELRRRLVGSLTERVTIAEAMADGKAMKEAHIPLHVVLKHATCPVCAGALEKLAEVTDADLAVVKLRGHESVTPGDRLRALDLMAKYGLGTKDEVTVVSPDVRARVERTVQLIGQQPTWDSAALLDRLDAIWGTD